MNIVIKYAWIWYGKDVLCELWLYFDFWRTKIQFFVWDLKFSQQVLILQSSEMWHCVFL